MFLVFQRSYAGFVFLLVSLLGMLEAAKVQGMPVGKGGKRRSA